jgi:hypothetical protein
VRPVTFLSVIYRILTHNPIYGRSLPAAALLAVASVYWMGLYMIADRGFAYL